tara:strand:+ start:245 stop:475 length:231 start_codon:yes stop_codon:yes gene_type:complete
MDNKDIDGRVDPTTIPTHEMVQNLAEHVVDSMSHQELTQFVYDDVYSMMLEDSDVFYTNLPEHLEPEDFTNAKFRD